MRKNILLLFIITLTTISCGNDFLEEKPQSFDTPEGVYKSSLGFESALNGLFSYARLDFDTWSDRLGGHGACPYEVLQVGTDVSFASTRDGSLGIFNTFAYGASNGYVRNRWKWAYGFIANANLMINNAENNDVIWKKAEDKVYFQANARFFRAYAYRYLVYLYGDVPWVTEISKKYRTDFPRTPKAEVLKNMIEDLEFAAKNLPENPSKVLDGQLTKGAALHLLSEICLLAGDNKRAETAAQELIDSKNYQLMKDRFGDQKDRPGDVFSDMFKNKNHNRAGGNLESIWVIQAEYKTDGGGTANLDWTKRAYVPAYWDIKGFDISAEYGGRGLGQVVPTAYWANLYEEGDIRNSEYNVRREYRYNKAAEGITVGDVHTITEADMLKGHLFPAITKFDYMPEGNPTYNGNDKDKCRFRLADTYLLLAEAHINQGNMAKAAEAINVVRSRAGVSPVQVADVNLDYLLDERARELYGEEFRRMTLLRTGKLIERTKLHNKISAEHITDKHLLWPIPREVIDANAEGAWVNNPGW